MHEDILPASVRSDETVAFRGVVELYGPGLLNKWFPRTVRRRTFRPRAPYRFLCRRAAVDAEHFGDLHALLPWTCPNLEASTGIDSTVPGALQDSGMQEGVTRPVREFDKPKTLLRIEPLHKGADGPARRLLETRLAGAERARRLVAGRRRSLIIIIIEASPARRPKVSLPAAQLDLPIN
jgi:hypothetical protein